MKITVAGGGPGGLYFALLTKKARPDFKVTVHEQNRAGDTFGFGVVFSDATLDEFLSADPQSYELIRDHFAYWDDIAIQHRNNRIVCGGNGFAGCSRVTLLEILQRRCREAGVELVFESRVEAGSLESRFADSDVIVASDGVNSPIREHYASAFGRTIRLHNNKFAWLGSSCPLDAFTFFFKETPWGLFCAHTYQYEEGRSTWVMETQPETWKRSGLAEMGEEESARFLGDLFSEELGGHPLVTNRSIWRNFPRIECAHWSHRNIVLLGDAKATAHWSIGSGTKLAMECAIALSRAVVRHAPDAAAAFREYQEARRTDVEITQHNADVSLQWFEHMDRYWHMEPMQFAMSVMSRSKSMTWDELKLRDGNFIAEVEDEFYARHFRETGIDCRRERPTPMFTPLPLRDVVVPNRVVVSPMAQYSARDGVPNDWHFVHLASRALGGPGLVGVEMTCTSPDARITDGCTGLWNDEQEAAFRRIVDFCHAHSPARLFMQLGHAGRKGSTQLGWEQMDMPKREGNWPVYSASPIPWFEGVSQVPIELDRAKMAEIEADFVQAAIRADRAGFDMLELHCAHGYLLASFLSPLTNTRTDEFGGSVANRLRYPLSVFRAVRAVWPAHKPMSVRLSACDWAEGGLTLEDFLAIVQAFKDAGADLADVSTGQTVPWQKPVYGRMYQAPFADAARNEVGIPAMTVGAITSADQVNTLIAAGRADLCALARPHLNYPSFAREAAGQYGVRRAADGWPVQYDSGAAQLFREMEKAGEKARETALKLRPKRHGYR
ncbi:MAG: bifunctional salicylyl-CoA 5-hydroxylase/oxidoreductase, partial [Alphaproteobacteria bacterium]